MLRVFVFLHYVVLEDLEELNDHVLLEVELHELLLDADSHGRVDLVVVQDVAGCVDPQRHLVFVIEEGRAVRDEHVDDDVLFFEDRLKDAIRAILLKVEA